MPSLFPCAAVLAAALLPALAPAASLTLEEALARAVQRSEATRAARAGVVSASEAARAAGQPPDPMLGLVLENLPITGPERLHLGREDMTMKRIALSQEWLGADKRFLRTAAADAMVARESAALAAAAADTRLHTALAYVEAFYTAADLKLGLEKEARAREAAETARARLAAAGTAAPEVLALLAARGMAADDSADIRQQAASAALGLARWTGVPVDALGPLRLDGAVSEQAFVERHPTVLASQRDVDVARQEAAVTASNRRPNWTWEIAYAQRSGRPDLVSLGVSIPLPVAPAQRQDRDTASKLARIEQAQAQRAEAQRAAQLEYRMLASDADRLAERIRSFGANVVDPARQRTAAATAAYASNQTAVSAVFEAHLADIEAQRRLLKLHRELAGVQVRLHFRPVQQEDLQ